MSSSIFPHMPSAPVSVSTFVMRSILSAIVSGRLKSGETLPTEAELAQQLSVGISSVREALSALQGMGVISVRHGSGRIVRGLTFSAISDVRVADAAVSGELLLQVTEVRQLLEAHSIRYATTHASPAALEEIRESVEAMELAVERGEMGVEEDGEFHLAIARSTGNLALVLLQESLNSLMNMIRYKSHAQEGRPAQAAREHRAIFTAVLSGNTELAEQLLQAHLDGGRQDASVLFPSAETH